MLLAVSSLLLLFTLAEVVLSLRTLVLIVEVVRRLC